MLTMIKFSFALGLGIVLIFTPENSMAAEPSEFPMVKKGVFKMDEGETIDITEHGILFHLNEISGKAGEQATRVVLKINGSGGGYSLGDRVDLKRFGTTEDYVKDVGVCILDLVTASVPKGGRPSATFRLVCE